MTAVGRKIDPTHSLVSMHSDHGTRIVAATIADDEDLEIGKRLPECAAD